jgi:hypothetical protein
MAALNFPAGRKLWCVNLAAKKAYGIGNAYPGAWTEIFTSWDWDGWIKPQIDYGAANGANCVRLIGSPGGVFAGTFTQAYYNACWDQLFAYCATLGMFVHLTPGWWASITANPPSIYNAGDGASMTNADVGAAINTLLTHLTPYNYMITGVDLVQEANDWYGLLGLSPAAARCQAIYNIVKPTTSLPLGFSSHLPWTGTTARDWIAAIATCVDFLDFHVYRHAGYTNDYPTPVIAASELSYWRTTYPTLDIMFGEFGSSEDLGADVQAWHYHCILETANVGDQRVRGAGFWAGLDGNDATNDMWGMYSNAGVPRLTKRNAFRRYTGGMVVDRT